MFVKLKASDKLINFLDKISASMLMMEHFAEWTTVRPIKIADLQRSYDRKFDQQDIFRRRPPSPPTCSLSSLPPDPTRSSRRVARFAVWSRDVINAFKYRLGFWFVLDRVLVRIRSAISSAALLLLELATSTSIPAAGNRLV